MTPEADKVAHVEAVRARMLATYRGMELSAACLYWAETTCEVLSRRLGMRAIIQAGTLNWPCMAVDDGVSPTHFSYQWEPDTPRTRAELAANRMPEMHVWCGLPSTGEIVDLTTCYLIQQAKARAGIEWNAPEPPPFFWATRAETPKGIYYYADPIATGAALYLLDVHAPIRQGVIK